MADDVGDLLASNIDEIQKVSEPADPGMYYVDEGDGGDALDRDDMTAAMADPLADADLDVSSDFDNAVDEPRGFY